ncbi:MAG: deoxycytidine triphosphate deaminase [Candidatus Parcubacteria bacterium]|nr:MAG: deoxycytidine triphosphate deaminase [Candidatus Parcubacteria bacterium]
MAYSDQRILEALKAGDIVISPFRRDNLGTASYDVTLGEWYYRESRTSLPVYNIYNRKHIERVWGPKPHRAQPASRALAGYDLEELGVNPNDKVILLEPGETILAHTEEFIGGLRHITTMMKARSSYGRSFIEVCKCAGWGDVGYINRWTMEITNNSRHYTIPLIVGRRIAQIVFFETGPILKDDYARNGKYAAANDLAALKRQWKPEMMLPRLWADREVSQPRQENPRHR